MCGDHFNKVGATHQKYVPISNFSEYSFSMPKLFVRFGTRHCRAIHHIKLSIVRSAAGTEGAVQMDELLLFPLHNVQ